MRAEWISYSIDETDRVAKQMLDTFPGQKKFAVYGEMGAGKTTFIKSLCRELGVKENTSSPTFAIVNEYKGDHRIWHYDLYRLQHLHELDETGLQEHLESNDFIFIEWPQLLEGILNEYDFAKITVEVSDTGRLITCEN